MKVVIAGGGFCGSMVGKRLDSEPDIDVTLIDKVEYYEYYPSLPKLITAPGYQEKIIKPYSQFLNNTELIKGEIEKITPSQVFTEKEKVDFDVLVISLGAKYPIFLKNKNDVFTISSIKEVKKLSEKVRNSERVLIVGGGLIGTEVASELASKTSKRVTLVHSHDRLIERNPKIVSYFAEKFLMKKGVNIRFNEKVVDHIDDIFKTNKGNEVEADVCIWSTGLSYDKGLYSDLDEIAIAENGSLSVNESLQVKGYSNIFAGGDITDIKEEKTGHNADSHSKIISENIFRMKDNRTLNTSSKLRVPLIISLGDINGILSSPFFGIPGPIPAVIKYLLEKGAILRL